MIPLRDSIPSSRAPVVTIALIGCCAVAFLFQLQDPEGRLIEQLGMVPARVMDPEQPHLLRYQELVAGRVRTVTRPLGAALLPDWLTPISCTFLHGGWLHFLGNMLFLWIFGDNVEDRFGRLRYLLFYLGAGAAASLAHLFTDPTSTVPTVGASGAIAGVMGAYFLLYPHARVQMLIVFGFFVDVVVLPASFFLGYWFVLQFFQGVLSLSSKVAGGGVAWWAHIGGFVVGWLVALLLRTVDALRPAPEALQLRYRRYALPRR